METLTLKDQALTTTVEQKVQSLNLRWKLNSCYIDAQIISLLCCLSQENTDFFAFKLQAFLMSLKHTNPKRKFVYIMQYLPAFNQYFRCNIIKNVYGSVGSLLHHLTEGRIANFRVSQPDDVQGVFFIDRPLLVVDGIKRLKKITKCSTVVFFNIGVHRVQFELKAMIGWCGHHWTTLAVHKNEQKFVNSNTFLCQEINVTKYGSVIKQVNGGEYQKKCKQHLFLYELNGSLLGHSHYKAIHAATKEYYKAKVIKFLKLQTICSSEKQELLKSCMKEIGVNDFKDVIVTEYTLFDLMKIFWESVVTDKILILKLKNFILYGCLESLKHPQLIRKLESLKL
tara:strand:- start:1725 stop:2744 length:1020 start_codon:yes stop_codon:yes gene_type:complete